MGLVLTPDRVAAMLPHIIRDAKGIIDANENGQQPGSQSQDFVSPDCLKVDVFSLRERIGCASG
jgi:hypothetical protein